MKKEEKIDHGDNHKGNITKSKTIEDISYACHTCGLNGHKMIDCPKFVEM
jgi:hypothetical protein